MKLHKEEQGQALVEMALVLPLLLLLLFGIIEMGRVGYAYITVSNAARSAARVATTGGMDLDIQNAAIIAAPSLNEAELTTVITPTQANRQSGQSVQVQVSYPVHLIVPLISDILPNPFVVNSTLSMRVE
ncbi:TadE/TadG family type IV pilus assembly protein [Desulfitobacterium metallireducens]|uniref:Pilus assembly protein TadE n=1 Tax=Desulfitobacterium metallireducens DSM 15288 TaxID=871968 RepID=W0ECS2_9FIRM|nr:TadE family protein [Desulfitobacterium metallireducens]AHF06871.1 pilus assembly protein TadE [Desulfitobacterium metallireducens DSM 15288]